MDILLSAVQQVCLGGVTFFKSCLLTEVCALPRSMGFVVLSCFAVKVVTDFNHFGLNVIQCFKVNMDFTDMV